MPLKTFEELQLTPPLLRAVKEAGYKEPSPIQQKAIPPVLAGRDLLGCAQTGTGKTAAFALPILQLLAHQKPDHKKIRSLVLTPTRELALQIEESFKLYGKYLPLRAAVIFGGVGQAPQVAALKKGVDILVATPGRLNDLIGQGYVRLENLEIFVLDEADRMLDMGFVNDVKKVMKFLPPKRQTLLFSATLPKEIVSLANGLLHNPAKVFVTPVSSTVESIEQKIYKVDKANKRHLLAWILKDKNIHNALVFTRTKHGADRVARDLNRAGVQAAAIHGNKSQSARQTALARFKKGEVRVLVATDIAARGLDIQELSHVINFDLPNVPETYVHRIGRTGRAGRGGTAISFCMPDEFEYLADIQKLIGFSIAEEKGHAWPIQTAQKPADAPPAAQPAPKPPKAPKPQKPAKENPAHAKRAGQPVKPASKQRDTRQAAKGPAGNKARAKGVPPAPIDPYSMEKGARAIVTKRPVWADTTPAPDEKGVDNMARNRRRGGKKRGKQTGAEPAEAKPKAPEIPKNPNGVFDFTEEELAEDDAIKVISRTNSETKYANFEDFLKDH